jgi:hypothetical protein
MILASAFNRGASSAGAERRTLSLRALLLLLVVTVALPLTALAALAVWHAYDQARGRAEAEVLGQVRTMTALVDREIQRVEVGLRALADSAALAKGDMAGVEAEMRAMSRQLDGTPIGLAAAEGQLLSTIWPPGERRAAAPVPPEYRPAGGRGGDPGGDPGGGARERASERARCGDAVTPCLRGRPAGRAAGRGAA